MQRRKQEIKKARFVWFVSVSNTGWFQTFSYQVKKVLVGLRLD